MSQYEGFVVSLKQNGKADVIIQPGKPSIPGAPEVSKRVCHCATDGSTVIVEALNRVGSGVGDLVSVSRTPGALMKSAATLLGLPAMGLILGIAVAVFLNQRLGVNEAGAVFVAVAGLVLGGIIAWVSYRRMAVNDQFTPVITRIIKRSAKRAVSSMAIDPVCKMQVEPATAASLEYQGKTYYFCHPGCRETFIKDPATYVKREDYERA